MSDFSRHEEAVVKNIESTAECLQRMSEVMNDMGKAIVNLNARIDGIERILITHNLARIP